MNKEIEMYDKQGNWDFSDIKYFSEYEIYWDMYEEVEKYSNQKSLILDLGTAGGEKIFSNYISKKDLCLEYIKHSLFWSNKKSDHLIRNLAKYLNRHSSKDS